MQAMIIKHTRTMAHSFAHVQHESTHHLHQRCRVPTAAEQLLKEATAFHRRLRLLLAEVPFISEALVESARDFAAKMQVTTTTQWNRLVPHSSTEAAFRCGQMAWEENTRGRPTIVRS